MRLPIGGKETAFLHFLPPAAQIMWTLAMKHRLQDGSLDVMPELKCFLLLSEALD